MARWVWNVLQYEKDCSNPDVVLEGFSHSAALVYRRKYICTVEHSAENDNFMGDEMDGLNLPSFMDSSCFLL